MLMHSEILSNENAEKGGKALKKTRAALVSSGTVCTIEHWELKFSIWEEIW